MTDDGNEKKEAEPDGISGEGQGGSGEYELGANKNDEEVKDRGGGSVQAQPVLQVRQQQHSQAIAACWERFLHLRSIKVLLVENDDSTCHVVAALLRNCNYEVMEADNGLQAWKILEDLSNHIDLVLTEVVMPCLSGIGLLCKIMSHKTRKNIPVIMMSSHDSMGLVFKCLSKGAVDFLLKPIRKNELKNLWQHVWRRCHSSSGSGSESGTQTLKSVKSKSSEKSNNSGSSDGDVNGSIGLNDGDGSDSASGTQSSWTKQAAEADSPQTVSPWARIAVCPDSACAQFISPNAEASGNKNMPVTATRESKEPGEDLDNVSRGKELVIGWPRDQDLQPEIPIEVPVKLIGRKQKLLSEIDTNTLTTHIDQGNLNPNGESPSTKYEVDITNTSYPQTDSRELEAPKGFSKALEIKDEAIIDSEEIAAHELSVERLSKVTDLGKTIQDDYDVLRHLELSTFSRCNTALSAFEAPNENTGSGSPLDHSFDDVKKELVCSHQPPCQCSNGIISNNNIDMGSDTDRNFANLVVFTEKSGAISTANCFDLSSSLKPMKTDLICTPQKAMLVKADERAATEVLAPPRGSYQEIPMQHLHHYNHFGKEKQQPPFSMDDLSFNKLAAESPQSGSSNVFSGHVEGKNGNYSLNKSASGSNHGRIHGNNGPNGSSTAANAGGIDIENFNAVAGKSGRCDASGRGSGKHRNQNQLAQNEAALTKFHQKRKERCFPKKVQHQSRKRQVEQRPHVQEQFVQQPDPENSSSAADS